MSSKFLIFLNFLSFTLLGQYPDFKFDREIIKNENIHHITVFEIHPTFKNHEKDSIFHSEYFFDHNGNILTRIFSKISHQRERFQTSFHRDSFSYESNNQIQKRYLFYTPKAIKFNSNKHHKIPKKILRKLKKAKWVLKEGFEVYKFDKQGNLLSLNWNSQQGEIINLSKFYYEFNKDHNITKKFYFNQDSSLTLMDSVIYLPNSNIEYYMIAGSISTKTINNFSPNGSCESVCYIFENNKYHSWRTFSYDKKGRLIKETQADKYLTKFIYHKNGLLRKIEEGGIKNNTPNKVLFLKYQKRKAQKK